MDLPLPKRIVVIGTTGSGKSRFAQILATALACPAIELDELYWLPGWVARKREGFRVLVDRATAAEAWVCAGNYAAVRDLVWRRADMIIWLDLGFWRTLSQLLGRSLHRAWTHEPICNGNTERLHRLFRRDSIILWFFQTYRPNRRRFGAIFAEPGELSGKRFVRLTDRRAMAAFRDSCASARPAAMAEAAGPSEVR